MKRLNILLIEDEEDYAEGLTELIESLGAGGMTDGEYEDLNLVHAADQNRASVAIRQSVFDLVLLDLRYPNDSGGDAADNGEFAGMKWLPELRRLQPDAAIVVMTAFSSGGALEKVVAAIRDFDADEFVPKTPTFSVLVARIRLALRYARHKRRTRRLESEYRALIRSRASRAYAEDILCRAEQTKIRVFQLAAELDSLDGDVVRGISDNLRSELHGVCKDIEALSRTLMGAAAGRCRVELDTIVREAVEFAQTGSTFGTAVELEGFDPAVAISVSTYPGDLRIALFEIMENAFEAAARRPPESGPPQVIIRMTPQERGAVISIIDNGPGFPAEVLRGEFVLQSTNRGHGLYITRRMMSSLGGDVSISNLTRGGGAQVDLSVPDLVSA